MKKDTTTQLNLVANQILSEEISMKLFLNPQNREIVLRAMHKFRNTKNIMNKLNKLKNE